MSVFSSRFSLDNARKFVGTVDRVIDGDTVDVYVDLGFRVVVHVRLRLIGVDTPERGEKGYQRAKDKLESMLSDDITFYCWKTGKYGRWLAYIEGVNEALAEEWPYV